MTIQTMQMLSESLLRDSVSNGSTVVIWFLYLGHFILGICFSTPSSHENISFRTRFGQTLTTSITSKSFISRYHERSIDKAIVDCID